VAIRQAAHEGLGLVKSLPRISKVVSRSGGTAALLATCVLLSACGGSSSNQSAKFKAGYVSTANQLKQTSIAIGRAIQQAPKRTDAQILATFRGLATRWQTHLSQLQTLEPPSNLAADYNTVTGAASRVEADLNAIVSAAATHSASAAEQAAASLVGDIETAKSASTKITNKLGSK
jgi:hypothetical protein